MIVSYPKEVVTVIDGLVSFLEGDADRLLCLEQLESLKQMQSSALRRSEQLRAAISEFPHLVKLAESQRVLLAQRETILEELTRQLEVGKVGIVEQGRLLQEVTHNLVECSRQLVSEREALQPEGPSPELDEWLKLARAVAENRADQRVLLPILTQAKSLDKRWQNQAKLFHQAFPEQTGLAEIHEKALEYYRNGIGAIMEFLQSGNTTILKDGIDLLGDAGRGLLHWQQTTSEIRQEKGSLSDPVLDCFAQVSRRVVAGKLPPESLEEHLKRLSRFAEFQQRQGLEFVEGSFPEAGLCKEWDTVVEPLHERFEELLSDIRELPIERLPQAHRELTELLRAGDSVLQKQRAWMTKGLQHRTFSKEPTWTDLQHAVVGWYLGLVPRASLHSTLRLVIAFGSDYLKQVSAAPQQERDGLRKAVEAPLHIFEKLRLAVVDDEKETAAKLLAKLEQVYDRWLWAKDTLEHLNPPLTGALLDQLLEAREQEQTLGGLRRILELAQRITSEASRRLDQWNRSCTQLTSENEDAAEISEILSSALRDLRDSLRVLSLHPDDSPLTEHDELLDKICAALESIEEGQEEAVSLGAAAEQPSEIQHAESKTPTP